MLTPQAEHARVAGLIASSWNFGADRPTDEAFYAITHHDDGWKSADEQPRINRGGEPMSFMEIDVLSGIEIWTRNAALLAEEGKFYAARLVAGHFAWLAENTIDLARLSPKAAIAIGRFIFEQRRAMENWRREGLVAAHSISARDAGVLLSPDDPSRSEEARFERDLRLLQVCDQLSLLLCTGFTGEHEIANVPYLEKGDRIVVTRKGELTLLLDPFPLKMKVRDHLTSLLVPKRPYESDDDLRDMISGTKPTTNEIHFRSASG